MLRSYPAKFGGYRHCGNEDINSPANTVTLQQMQDICDCICLLTSTIIFFSKAHITTKGTIFLETFYCV